MKETNCEEFEQKEDLFEPTRKAIEYCKEYRIKKGSKMYDACIASFTCGWDIAKNKYKSK